jgi:hypothetical protein
MRAAAFTLAALVLALAGCGGGDDTTTGAAPTTTADATTTAATPPPSEPADTALTVVVWESGKKGPKVKTTLECDPVGGTHPLPQESCTQLQEHPEYIRPVPRDTACVQIYGGPQVARVFGTLDGKKIDAKFNRANGCEISRWDSLEPLFKIVVD